MLAETGLLIFILRLAQTLSGYLHPCILFIEKLPRLHHE